ncbi:unnamed protein product [Malus baccata var. baccata]
MMTWQSTNDLDDDLAVGIFWNSTALYKAKAKSIMSDSVKIEGLLGMLTVKLQDDNFVKWSYQFQSVLRGYDLFNHFTGESPCPPRFVIDTEAGVTTEITVAYKTWVKKDLALLSLLIATLRWNMSSVAKHHMKLGPKGGESVEKFMLKLKGIKDQLISAGEKITDNDYMIVVLSGLPVEFEVIKTIILARETSMSLKDFRAQLLGAEASIETRMHSLSSSMAAMVVQGEGSHSQRFQGGYEHGESSNSKGDFYHGSQSNVPGGSGYVGTANRSFQQRNNGQNNYSRRFNNGNNNSKFYSGSYGNRNGNSYDGNGSNTYSGNGKQSQNGNSWNTRTNNWNGNTNYKSSISPECQICSRRGAYCSKLLLQS